MNFWNKLRAKLSQWMMGRYGMDQLGVILMAIGLIVYFINLFTPSLLLSAITLILYGIVIYRMLSRDRARRARENQKVMGFYYRIKTKTRQAFLRLKNRKEYKYFKCPQCHAILRLKRGAGEVHVTCGKCKHQFDKKA